jgi:4'-phosphopantetheinyl transferase
MPAQPIKILQYSGVPTHNLQPNCIHIVTVALEDLGPNIDNLLSTLNINEISRINKFSKPILAERYGLTRGMLRLLIGHYLELPPKCIDFSYNEHGKPALIPNRGSPSLFFNLSHSNEVICYAFTLNLRIGIDVEYIDPERRFNSLARYICTTKELETYTNLRTQEEKLHAFFELWTRKEALVKADGRGLSMGLRSIEIGFQSGDITGYFYKGNYYSDWIIKDIDIGLNNYKTAVAFEYSKTYKA